MSDKSEPAFTPRLVPSRVLLLVGTVLFAATVLFHLACALRGHSMYRASYLGTALEYARGPVDLLHPVIVGFNATGTPTAQELPVWQAAAGLAMKVLRSEWLGWANLTSLVLFATCLWPFHRLAVLWLGERPAAWALVFLLAQPLIVMFAGEAGPDAYALAVSIWFLFFSDKFLRSRRLLWVLPAAGFAALAAVTKLPFFMAAGLCSLFMLLLLRPRDIRAWLMLAGSGAMAAVAFFAWTRYADALSAQAVYPYVELRLSQSGFIRYWYFGDLAYRLNPAHWARGAWRFVHATLGTLPMLAVFLPSLLTREARFPRLWLLATLLTSFVFTHLVLEHWHYYLMCSPAVALLCGIAITRLELSAARLGSNSAWFAGLVIGALLLSTIDGLVLSKVSLKLDTHPKYLAGIIREHTSPADKLVLYSSDLNWGGEELFLSGRQGLSVMSLRAGPRGPSPKGLFDLLESEDDLRKLVSLGYTKVVLTSESPARTAARSSKPGKASRRELYPADLPAPIASWRTVYKDEDLLIKELPRN
jgi:hypothetical protein